MDKSNWAQTAEKILKIFLMSDLASDLFGEIFPALQHRRHPHLHAVLLVIFSTTEMLRRGRSTAAALD
jgi:hypothetical protein